MSVTTVPLEIVCPDWCDISPALHAADLWDMGGNCIHLSRDVEVPDPTGYCEPLEDPRFHETVRIFLTSSARPEGRESASPILHIDGREHSIAQALALAEALTAMVATYREAGGVE